MGTHPCVLKYTHSECPAHRRKAWRLIALADKISKSFGGRILYSAATLQLNAGERWGLVGPNGAGKTTLLRIIMGQEGADEGTVSFTKDITLGYLEQETLISGTKSALSEVVDSAVEIRRLEARIKKMEHQIAETSGEDQRLLERYGQAQDRFERLGGYALEARARQILCGLGFPTQDLAKPAAEFSGGWQMRIALSKLLLRHPDLLLLDEPTNHLDLESVGWLESFISSYDGAVLLVSHDRSFMDACVSHIASLENKRLVTYVGNYSNYLRQREDNLEQLRAKRAAQERDINHMQVFVDKFRYKPTKARQVQERIRRIEKVQEELVTLPEAPKRLRFKFPDPPRTGDLVASLEGVAKAYGKNLVYEGVNLKLYRGDHVALVGPNGAGKSTLMKLICGREGPTAGTIELGQNVTQSYYAQHQLETLKESMTVLQEMDEAAPGWTSSEERRLLGAFLFHGDDVDKRVQEVFEAAYHDVEHTFGEVFQRLFPGGEGKLLLTEPGNWLETGVDVEARPAGKKVKRLSLLSGGERSLAAVALLIAIFKARPSPFYVMDEVEAALDDTNLGRLLEIFTELRASSQLIIITHQKRTMEVADALYGISMRDGITKAVSQRLAHQG